jgi:hypothetical protein
VIRPLITLALVELRVGLGVAAILLCLAHTDAQATSEVHRIRRHRITQRRAH